MDEVPPRTFAAASCVEPWPRTLWSHTAHAMIAVGLRIGREMLARSPVAVDGATVFAARLFAEASLACLGMRSRFTLLAACALLPAALHRLGRLHGRDLREPTVDVLRPDLRGGGLQAGARDHELRRRARPASTEYARLTEYLNAAQSSGVEPLVSFQHARGDSSSCDQKQNLRPGHLQAPEPEGVREAMKAFFAAFPTVKVISPWNETNHFTQPTSRSPASAAKFTNTVAKLCKRLQDRRGRHPRPGRRPRRQEPEVHHDGEVHRDLPQVR